MPLAMRTSLTLILALALALGGGCGSQPPPHAAGPAGSQPATSTPTTPAAPGASAAATPGPAAIELPAAALPPHGTLLLGDLHGTREIPAFVGAVVATASARESVVLALEIPADLGPSLQAFLASDGGPEARRRLVATPWWQDPYQDGRRSVATAELLDTVRRLRAAGRRIEVIGIDVAAGAEREAREEGMARNVIDARRAHPEAALVVHAGNLHTSKREVPSSPGYAWMAMRIERAGVPLVSLNPRWGDGTAWTCRDAQADHCGASFLAGRDVERGIHLESLRDGQYDGWFGVGPVTASPPAGRPELAAGIEGKIAAALASPQAVRGRARRAYDARRYSECADLLATIAAPDADAAYDHACCLALAGRKDEAFGRLQFALGAGFKDLDQLAKDPDLAPLRGDPRWPIKP
jgi:hypothetical protein